MTAGSTVNRRSLKSMGHPNSTVATAEREACRVFPFEVSSMRASAIAVCVVVLGVATPAGAQGLEFGAKGGVNLAKLSFDSDIGDTSLKIEPGLAAGGFM